MNEVKKLPESTTRPCEIRGEEMGERALSAMQDLIVFTAQSGGPGRFARAGRLCNLAHQVEKETRPSVEGAMEDAEGGYYVGQVGQIARPIGGVVDQANTLRELVDTTMATLKKNEPTAEELRDTERRRLLRAVSEFHRNAEEATSPEIRDLMQAEVDKSKARLAELDREQASEIRVVEKEQTQDPTGGPEGPPESRF
jgi:hypothetical protein